MHGRELLMSFAVLFLMPKSGLLKDDIELGYWVVWRRIFMKIGNFLILKQVSSSFYSLSYDLNRHFEINFFIIFFKLSRQDRSFT